MRVEVVRAWPQRFQALTLELAEVAVLGDAVAAAGWQDDAQISGYAVFGVKALADTPLRDGDRVELLRPLQVDPKDARRRRAADRPLKK
ncbi:RnfH family protein [Lysobacter capsici]|uniref:RnfH family protein n=1 Tax=Lysobacter capsici TaxID=435897 RepID=UPI00287B6D6D|nr:RnfH family protein [Lysobacter capsici]WND82854.1 RnfH family protein [Lysobacter capsici]WND88052.1 RnfH family protein [Lysobacter capsici]